MKAQSDMPLMPRLIRDVLHTSFPMLDLHVLCAEVSGEAQCMARRTAVLGVTIRSKPNHISTWAIANSWLAVEPEWQDENGEQKAKPHTMRRPWCHVKLRSAHGRR